MNWNIPDLKRVEDIKFTSEPRGFKNQTFSSTLKDEQSDMVFHAPIENMGFKPPPVVSVSQLIPKVSEWVGQFLKSRSEQSSSTEAKIALLPEHLGPIQIKVIDENRKVTVQIITDKNPGKEVIDGLLPNFRQSFVQQGIPVQKLEIIQNPMQFIDKSQNISPMLNRGLLAAIKGRENPILPPVVHVSQFVPVMSKMIGEILKTNPEQNGNGRAKIALQPEQLGPIQIKVTTVNGKVNCPNCNGNDFRKRITRKPVCSLKADITTARDSRSKNRYQTPATNGKTKYHDIRN